MIPAISASAALRSELRAVDVSSLDADDCASVVEEMARLEKSCTSLRAMAAARATAYGEHIRRGHRHPEDWLARSTGTTRQQARSELKTGERLDDCPTTAAAARDGELSLGQASDITETERKKPGSEKDLVQRAKTSTRQQLADACRRKRQEGVDRERLAAEQHAKRSFRSWTNGDGMVCGAFQLTPLVGAPLVRRLQEEADRQHRSARKAGSTEAWPAHAADALVNVLQSGLGVDGTNLDQPHGAGSTTPAAGASSSTATGAAASTTTVRKRRRSANREVVIVVDLQTYRTGEHPDTTCHLIGGGPVPVSVVREMSKDAFLKVVFHDGVNVHTVTHVGRYIPAELRTALEVGRPVDFDGPRCSQCGTTFRLQWDHLDPVCADGLTSLANEDAKCYQCHQRKSDAERAAGIYAAAARARDDP